MTSGRPKGSKNYPDQSPEAKKAREAARGAKRRKENAESIAARKAEYQKENAESIAARQVKYAKENAESIAAYQVEYRKENAESIAARAAEYQKKNVESITALRAEYRKENAEVICKSNRKRRVLKLALPYVEHVTPMPADGCCPHCHVAMTGKWPALNTPIPDHIVPLNKGGHHTPDNTLMICNQCNLIKGNRPLSYLLKKIAARQPVLEGRDHERNLEAV